MKPYIMAVSVLLLLGATIESYQFRKRLMRHGQALLLTVSSGFSYVKLNKSNGVLEFAFSATEDEFRRSGVTLDSVKIIPEQGGGYYALIEVVHYLHCLVCRKILLEHYDFSPAHISVE